MEWIIGLLVLVVVVGLWLGMTYNKLVNLRNRVENAWSQVHVQLKRRWDLIPNLVATVKGYAAHESGTFEAVTAARNAEAYPDLKANQNFLSLQTELTATEDKIAYSRQFYNDTTLTFNTTVEQFPANLVAGMFGFLRREFFETDAAETGPVSVSFE